MGPVIWERLCQSGAEDVNKVRASHSAPAGSPDLGPVVRKNTHTLKMLSGVGNPAQIVPELQFPQIIGGPSQQKKAGILWISHGNCNAIVLG